MLILYLKKIIRVPLYFIAWLILTFILSIILGVFFSPAFIAVFSLIGIIILISAITIKNRYNDGKNRREYLSNTGGFKLKTEISKVIRNNDFIADILVFATFALIMVIISALKLIAQTHIIIWLLATLIFICLTTVLLSAIDILYWLVIKYKWYKERIENKNYWKS